MKKVGRITIIILALSIFFCLTYYLYKGMSQKTISRENTRIVVVFKDFEHMSEFWKVVKTGAETAAKEFDINVEFTGSDSESNISGQISVIEKVIKTNPSAIVLAASDYNAIVPIAEKIKKSGIVLITIDSALNSEVPDSFIGTDNVEAGKKAGQALQRLLGKERKYAIVSYVKGSATAIEREKGFKEGCGEQGLLGTYFCDDYSAKAYEITKEILTRNKDIDAIAGLNEISTVGAANAIKDLGLGGKVKLVGFDSSINEVKFIEEGVIQATVVQKPFNMGYLGIKESIQCLKGEKTEKSINTGSELVTKDKMYTQENQKLLFPFLE